MIANNLRRLRKKMGLSQEKLARLADISLNTLTKIESGFAKKPTIQTVVKLAKALEVSLDELVKNREKADVIFSETEGITPFDSDKIISEYL